MTRPPIRSVALAVLLAVRAALAAPPFHPFARHVTLAAGTLLPSHRSASQRDDDVRTLYDAWKGRYLASAGSEADGRPRYRVRTTHAVGADTVSEGQGYGMIIVALMAGYDPDAQTIFDGLWEFAKDHPSSVDGRLMDWKVPANESLNASGNDSAFDGDCDMAFALLLAATQWGNGGRFDYRAEAGAVVDGILASTIGPASRLPMLGDWVDPNGDTYSQYTPRTSDFMLDDFRAFAAATGDPAWTQVIAASHAAVAHVQATYSPATGLLPDFLEPVAEGDTSLRPAHPNFLEDPHDGDYFYNAVRVPFRLGVDAALNGDPLSRDEVRKISLWAAAAASGDPSQVFAGRRLDGTLLAGNDYETTVFLAPLGVAAMSTPGQQTWLNALYDAIRLSDEGYYEDTVSLLCLLAMTGNYWNPSVVGPQPVCGNHVVETGEACDDGNATDGDGCDANCTPTGCGNGIVTAGETCDDGNTVAGDCCGATCLLEPDGSPCDDGDPCATADACTAGACAGTLAPATGCASASGRLIVKNDAPQSRSVSWRWTRGSTTLAAFDDPVDGGTSYALCVYDTAGGSPDLWLRATAPAGGGWKATRNGFNYASPAALPDRLRKLRLKAGAGNASIRVDAAGAALPTLVLPLAQEPVVTVQLHAAGGACWDAHYPAPALRNDASRFIDDAQ